MDTYSFLREFADSWFLIALFGFFLGAGIWAYWPGQRQARQDAAAIPFRDEQKSCGKSCANCVAKSEVLKGLTDG